MAGALHDVQVAAHVLVGVLQRHPQQPLAQAVVHNVLAVPLPRAHLAKGLHRAAPAARPVGPGAYGAEAAGPQGLPDFVEVVELGHAALVAGEVGGRPGLVPEAQGDARQSPEPDPAYEVSLLLGRQVHGDEVVLLAGGRAHVDSAVRVPLVRGPVHARVHALDGLGPGNLALLGRLLGRLSGRLPLGSARPARVARVGLAVPEGVVGTAGGAAAGSPRDVRGAAGQGRQTRAREATDLRRGHLHGVPEVLAVPAADLRLGRGRDRARLGRGFGRNTVRLPPPRRAVLGLHRRAVARLAYARADVHTIIGVPAISVPVARTVLSCEVRCRRHGQVWHTGCSIA
mmetsp:Transcript_114344/g.356060  ORF Transcript_114344/g.356060 Transcript_114344/m.356060 type:complete len:343 (+) Transcript_114344:1138-2166(+)